MATTTETKTRKAHIKFLEPLIRAKGKYAAPKRGVPPSKPPPKAAAQKKPQPLQSAPPDQWVGYAVCPPPNPAQNVVRGFETPGQAGTGYRREAADCGDRNGAVLVNAVKRELPVYQPFVPKRNNRLAANMHRPGLEVVLEQFDDQCEQFPPIESIAICQKSLPSGPRQSPTGYVRPWGHMKDPIAQLAQSPVNVTIRGGRHATTTDHKDIYPDQQQMINIPSDLRLHSQLKKPIFRFDSDGAIYRSRVTNKMVEIFERGLCGWTVGKKPEMGVKDYGFRVRKWETSIITEDLRRGNPLQVMAVVELIKEQREEREKILRERVKEEIRKQKILEYERSVYWSRLGLEELH